MTQDIDDIEKYAQAIMDVGAEVGSHIDGDARIQTFTFNEAQVVAFAELVAEEARLEERARIVEYVQKAYCTQEHKDKHYCGFNDGEQVCDCYNEALDDLIAHLSDK